MRFVRLLVVALVATMMAVLSVGSVGAQQQQNPTFTLQPGGTAQITYEAFCTDYGLDFPDGVQTPNGLAPAPIQGALAFIQQQGYSADQTQALEAQTAIWELAGQNPDTQSGAITQNVLNAANTAPVTPQGTSLLDAVAANQVTINLDTWQPLGQPVQIGTVTDNFYGRGTLTVTNNSNQALTLYMPIGTLFPPTTQGAQTMAGFATNVQTTALATPTPTPAPTAAATAAPAPTDVAGGQTTQPQQLPTTGAEEGINWLLLMLVVGSITLGWFTLRQSRN